MAHSIQVVGNKAYHFNDLDLLALVALARLELEGKTELGRVQRIVANWDRALAMYGPGTIDLGLEELSEPDDKRELLRLVDRVRSRLERYGSSIPSAALNSRCTAPGVVFNDYSTAPVMSVVDELEEIFRNGA